MKAPSALGLAETLIQFQFLSHIACADSIHQFVASRQEKSGNPVFEGWYADPDARIFENEYWIYPTVSTDYEKQTYFEAFSSPDLITWTNRGRILDFATVPWSTNTAAWAPTVGFKDGAYYIYFSAGDGAGIGVANASSPDGPFVDMLGKPLINETLYGAQPIDADIYIDDDGRNYLYYGGWSHGIVVELGDDMVTFKSDFVEITPPDYVEAPWMLKRGGTYYLFYSVGGWGDGSYAVQYVTGDSPMGPFSSEAKKILSSNPDVGTGTGHNSILNVDDDYYMVYHRHYPNSTDGNERVVCIDRMYFSDDGEVEPVEVTNKGVDARPL